MNPLYVVTMHRLGSDWRDVMGVFKTHKAALDQIAEWQQEDFEDYIENTMYNVEMFDLVDEN